ncbi:MAG: hypothetical protein GF308_08700 [Candidatus Heimdallarchaeota archaeon]|nr:hypothetical protein [Candidatus Heimdallarchaeota archaeon]
MNRCRMTYLYPLIIVCLLGTTQFIMGPKTLAVQASCNEKRPTPPYKFSFPFTLDEMTPYYKTYESPYSIEHNARISFTCTIQEESECSGIFDLYANIFCMEEGAEFSREDLSWEIEPTEGPWVLSPGEALKGEFSLIFKGTGVTQKLYAKISKDNADDLLIGYLNFTVINWGRTRGLFEQLLVSFGIGVGIIAVIGLIMLAITYFTGELKIASLLKAEQEEKKQKITQEEKLRIELVEKEKEIIELYNVKDDDQNITNPSEDK